MRRVVTSLVAALLMTAGLVASPALLGAVKAAAAGPCGPPVASAIACENSLPGDPQTDWAIGSSGDPSIQGFATSISVNAGQTVSFKVNSTGSAYHFDILRLGWYGGDGARKVASHIAPTAAFPQRQPACLTNSATGIIDCGNWAVSASWSVPAGAVSGYYLAHLVRDDNAGSSLIPFIVRNDGNTSAIVMEANDQTWEAYNSYGGNSLYGCTVACPPGNPQTYKGAFAVSYNRPFHTADDDFGRSWLFYAEFPMIEFLEENGYDVTYVASADVDTNGAQLLNHRVFLDAGHDEYWSAAQRSAVQNAINHGVNASFFSGNEVFWKTRFAPSQDGTNTPERTLITYKETHFDAPTDPADPPTWTGTWADPRFSPPADGGNPPNALTGQDFVVNAGSSDLKVPGTYAKLRLWRNTAVANLTPSQTLTLDPGGQTLGYEWDVDADNGFRPTGLFDLSSTTVSGTQAFIDYGSNVGTATVTHHLTEYRAPSGALVFGAGTVQWSWGLVDGTASGQPHDATMQQATVNLFADMGVQPYSLITGLVPASATTNANPPSSTVTAPTAGSTVADGSRVTVSGTASSVAGTVAEVDVSTDGGTTWHAASGTTSWTYSWVAHGAPTATVMSRAVDDSGNIEVPKAGLGVNVTCPCALWGNGVTPPTPDSGVTTGAEVGLKFTSDVFGTVSGVRFYKASLNTGTHVGNLWTSSGQLLASATFTGESASGWQQVTFSSPVAIMPQTTYIVSYYAPKGHYAADANYFFGPPSAMLSLPVVTDSPPLHALHGPASVGNGVSAPSGSSTFPLNADSEATNFWVEPVFSPSAAPGVPGTPTAVAGYASAAVSWSSPSSGGPVTSYTVTPFANGQALAPVTVRGNPAPAGTTVTGLTNGVTYTFSVTAANPVGTSASSPLSNAVTPSASASAVANGGFESGLSPWAGSGPGTVSVSTAKAHTATHSALVGTVSPGTEPSGDTSLSEGVTVPNGTSQLSFWYWPGSTDTLCTGAACTFDWQEAQLRSTSGTTLASVFKSDSNDQVWEQVTFNTTPYAGQSIVLWFNVHQDAGGDPTWMYVDDVSLVATGPPSAPGTPSGVSAVAGGASATVTWTAPSNGGSPITSYTVTPYIGSSAQPAVTVAGSPPPTSQIITGLTPGTAYTFTVYATNSVGSSTASPNSNAVTPNAAVAPLTPTGVVASAGDKTAAVSWTAPNNGGSPITSYTVTPHIADETNAALPPTTVAGTPPATTATISGLTDGTAYTFTVTATNSIGTSPSSSPSNTVTPNAPATVPGAPTGVAATPDDQAATVTWTAPANGGSAITAYVITPFIGSTAQQARILSGSPPPTTATVSGLSNGTTYTFTVAAVNAIGTSAASTPSNAVTPAPASPPGAPTNVSAVAGTGSAVVTWTAGASNGATITSYTVTPFIGTAPQTPVTVSGAPAPTSATVNGLVNGSTYTFTVTATNSAGTSAPSAPSNAVTPTGPPSAPGAVTATAGAGSISLSWSPPNNGGSTITSYTVTPFVGGAAQGPVTVSGNPAPTTTTVTGLANGTTYTFTVSATNAFGTSSATSSNPATPLASVSCPCTLFGTVTPATPDSGDASSVNLGMEFTADRAGFVSGVRFYKSAANGGTHVGSLWTGSGTLLASATFTGETASGWQQVTFANPVSLTVGTTYVVSYLAPVGHYAAAAQGFASMVSAPPLYGLASGSLTPNGLYSYGSGSAFPTSTFGASNYYVDAIFTTSSATLPSAPTGVVGVAQNGAAALSWSAPAVGSSSVTSYTITPYKGTTALTPVTVTGTPPATTAQVTGLVNGTTYTFTVAASSPSGTGPPSVASNPVTPEVSVSCPCTVFGPTAPAVADAGDPSSVNLGMAFTSDTNGFASGVRFYKSAANTGTHVGSLWSSTGTLLASVTFTNETATGWQQANFSAPVAIAAGSEYVVSYLAPAGHYAAASGGLNSMVTAPPLYALANGAGSANGVYAYASTPTFPTSAGNGTNYFVDVVFTSSSSAVPGQPTGVVATAGSGSVSVSWSAPSSGGGSVTSYTVTPFVGSVAQTPVTVGGTPPPTTVQVNALANGTTYTFTVSATSSGGTGPTSVASNPATPLASLTCACTLFGASAPAVVDSGETTSLNVGVQFTADRNGFITGIRFYKAAANGGSHVGSLWTATGTLLASATFTNESASGWQQVTFASPVAVTAGTAYVASYLAPLGHYSDTLNAFTSLAASPPLYALANGGGSPNGVYLYSATNAFPSVSGNGANYFVDVVFMTNTGTPPGAPSGVTATPGGGSATVSWTAPSSGDSPITAYTVTPFVGSTAQAPLTVSGSPPPTTANVTGLTNGTTYTFTVSATSAVGTGPASAPSNAVTPSAALVPSAPTGVVATAGAANISVSWSAPSTGASSITSYTVTPFVGAAAQTPVTVSGAPPPTTANVTGLANGTTYTFTVTATSAAGTSPASAASNPATPLASVSCMCTLFGSATPATVDSGDAGSVNVGVQFTADRSGYIAGIRFYKAAANIGTHVGTLWSSAGALLASATFTNESASGWQQVMFGSPVAVSAGSTYVASYLAPVGHYSDSAGAFASMVSSPPLYALANTAGTPNGVYAYASTSTFPSNTYNATNYFVDVVFTVNAGALPGAPTAVSATAGNATATVSWTAPAAGSSPILSYTVTPYIGATAQPPVIVSGSPPATTANVTGLTNGTTYTFTVSATTAVGTGQPSSPSNPATPSTSAACPCTLLGSATPPVADSGDTGSVNLGMQFVPDRNGTVTGVRFYKAVTNTGTHIGSLWSSTGALLASATFTNETASGWQQVSFGSPVAVTAGTTYVVSYLAPNGHYSVGGQGFASAVSVPPLYAPASSASTPNGLYAYGSANAFPASTYNASNYYVDVTFQ